MALTVKDLREILNYKGFRDDAGGNLGAMEIGKKHER